MVHGFGRSTTKILVERQRVGIVGLHEAFTEIEEAGLSDREAIASRLFEILSHKNYIPASQAEAYRVAFLREFLRYRGEDITALYSEIDVLVRGVPGDTRDRFVDAVSSLFSDFELRPIVHLADPDADGPHPKLLIDDEAVIVGDMPSSAMRPLIKRWISDW